VGLPLLSTSRGTTHTCFTPWHLHRSWPLADLLCYGWQLPSRQLFALTPAFCRPAALVKAAGSRGLAASVQMGCMRALSNLVHALRLRPPEHVDYRDPSLVRSI
jgi:hypothetical protein